MMEMTRLEVLDEASIALLSRTSSNASGVSGTSYMPSCSNTEYLASCSNITTTNPEDIEQVSPDPPRSSINRSTESQVRRRRRLNLRKVRDEMSINNFGLEHNAPHLFVTSQWQQLNHLSCLYLGYRLFWALYFLMWGLWSWNGSMGYGAPLSLKVFYLLYMTNWGLWTLIVDALLQAVNTIRHFRKLAYDGEPRYNNMGTLFKLSWVLSNTTSSMHLFITFAYWITVYPLRSDQNLNEIGINTHLMPGLYILMDLAVSGTPRRLLHAYQPMCFLTVYTLFNLIYFLCGGLDYQGLPALYPVLDWTKPIQTSVIMSSVIFILMPILHTLVCGLYAIRIKLWRILKITRYTREEDEVEKASTHIAQEQNV